MASDHVKEAPLEVPWVDWGPPVTAIADSGSDALSRWITTTCGQRFVTLLNESGPAILMVYDFNPLNVRLVKRLLEEDPHLKDTTWYEIEERSLDVDVFEEPVLSTLPYAIYTSKQAHWWQGILIDGQSILGLQASKSRRNF
jgi:hypothetical protein